MKPNLANDIITISEFKKNTSHFLQGIRKSGRTVVLTQNGSSAAIVLSPKLYERMQYERDLFAAIAKGEKEIQEGRGVPNEKVFQDLFRRLKSD